MKYNFYAEDENHWYYTTGKAVGGFFKSEERRAICKLCGMDYRLPLRHGPLPLAECVLRGTGSTRQSEICTECGQRVDEAITLVLNEIEDVAICPNCLKEHHGLEFLEYKFQLLRSYVEMTRRSWRETHGS